MSAAASQTVRGCLQHVRGKQRFRSRFELAFSLVTLLFLRDNHQNQQHLFDQSTVTILSQWFRVHSTHINTHTHTHAHPTTLPFRRFVPTHAGQQIRRQVAYQSTAPATPHT